MTPTSRTWVDNGTLDFNGFTSPPVSSGADPVEDDPVRSGPEERTWNSVPHGSGGPDPTRGVGDRAVAPFGGHSRISAPMLMVWPMGNPKYSTGFAELWAMVKNSRFCQPGMVGRVERATVILDRK